jgi:DNA polymerase-3 subunit chi
MGAVYFYHLTRRPLEATLPVLLEKSLEAGWRVAVKGLYRDRLDWLDQKLWTYSDEAFLPHGLAGGPQDSLQPILLTTSDDHPNGANCVLCVDGADITPKQVQGLERASILFDGNDPEAVQAARVQWKTLTDAGCAAQYWSEESGRWEKKAEKA